jgi:hypothetical protein
VALAIFGRESSGKDLHSVGCSFLNELDLGEQHARLDSPRDVLSLIQDMLGEEITLTLSVQYPPRAPLVVMLRPRCLHTTVERAAGGAEPEKNLKHVSITFSGAPKAEVCMQARYLSEWKGNDAAKICGILACFLCDTVIRRPHLGGSGVMRKNEVDMCYSLRSIA